MALHFAAHFYLIANQRVAKPRNERAARSSRLVIAELFYAFCARSRAGAYRIVIQWVV
jgi:hypothetical protein